MNKKVTLIGIFLISILLLVIFSLYFKIWNPSWNPFKNISYLKGYSYYYNEKYKYRVLYPDTWMTDTKLQEWVEFTDPIHTFTRFWIYVEHNLTLSSIEDAKDYFEKLDLVVENIEEVTVNGRKGYDAICNVTLGNRTYEDRKIRVLTIPSKNKIYFINFLVDSELFDSYNSDIFNTIINSFTIEGD